MPNQLAPDRREQIVLLLRTHRSMRIADLAQQVHTSTVTVRRDLEQLEDEGIIERIHGGARINPLHKPSEKEALNPSRHPTPEQAVARATANLVTSGTVVGIAAGSASLQFAHALASRGDFHDLTIVTNSPAISDAFAAVEKVTVVLIGGVRTASGALVGPIAAVALRQLHLHLFVVGCDGLDPGHGATTADLLEAESRRAFMAQAAETVVMAEAPRWGAAGFTTFAELEEIDVLVTDKPLIAGEAASILQRVARVLIVEPGGVTSRWLSNTNIPRPRPGSYSP